MSTTFQYVSDVHLECYPDNFVFKLRRAAPFLLLAGDIGDPTKPNYAAFLEHASRTFERVFLTAGNHEYHNLENDHARSMYQTDVLLGQICASLPNVVYLQNDIYELPGTNIVIFGSTLWTQIDPAEAPAITKRIADYSRIPSFSVETCCDLHLTAVNKFRWFRDNLHRSKRFVVMTHHMPHTSLIDARYLGSGINSAYASDTDCFEDNDRIAAIVYGHTHIAYSRGKYHVNPHGYPDENRSNILKVSKFSVRPPGPLSHLHTREALHSSEGGPAVL